jgi:hypothetical protein
MTDPPAPNAEAVATRMTGGCCHARPDKRYTTLYYAALASQVVDDRKSVEPQLHHLDGAGSRRPPRSLVCAKHRRAQRKRQVG